MKWLLVLAGAVSGCGSDEECTFETEPLPQTGTFVDPYAFALPDCVQGGIADLPGRWFVVDPASVFQFSYPKFAGTCGGGFRYHTDPEQPPMDDGITPAPYSLSWWSDGTRYFRRYADSFLVDGVHFEVVRAFVACMQKDGTLAAIDAYFDTDRGERISRVMTGTRFARKDELARGLALLGELGERKAYSPIVGYNVDVAGTTAYIVGDRGLDIVDVANPAAPVHLTYYEGSFNDVRVVGAAGKTYVFVAPRGEETTQILDATVPSAPVKVGELPYAHSLQVATRGAATLLYLATYTQGVPEYDITNPLAPVLVGTATVPGNDKAGVHDLTPAGDILYVNDTTEGTVALDISAGIANAREIGRTPSAYSHASQAGVAGGRPIVLHGDEGMTKTPALGAHLRILDGDPASPTYMQDIGKYQTRREVGIHNFQLVGDKVYIAYYQDGVRVVDLSNPTEPRELAHYNTWDDANAPGAPFEGALGIRVVADRIYVADSERGLMIFRED